MTKGSEIWLQTVLKPPPHLLLVGGGVDAQPLVALAVTLGWQVSLWDSRPANARREYFLAATNILREPIESLHDNPTLATCDAAIVMSHNLQMDAAAINLLQKSNVKYLALLGPTTRKQQVLQLAQLTEQTLAIPIAGPAGLDLGGELPEAIRAVNIGRVPCAIAEGQRSIAEWYLEHGSPLAKRSICPCR